MDNISPHITYLEATRTSTGLPNEPNAEQVESMVLAANRVFEPVRRFINAPIIVSSFFRSPKVNAAVGGSATSQHVKGEAIDIKRTGQNSKIFEYIKNKLTFDQLIWEFGTETEPAWVHVSYKRNGNRMQVLKAVKVNGKTKYIRL
ncbi:MAG: D-Ala-D-Ala carboxypeptidase family metallohydrolase [Candidatus Auribacterota bacterium]|jgi:hypothetical protein|nr:D-Ala-D-Ala carboxypeptidase family metallohydrolase [Candidatus Auribacterota bacterium]